jgi:transcription elongation factor Elf1
MKIKCPKCQSEEVKPTKSWTVKSPRAEHTLKVSMMLCQNCGKKFRHAEKE